MITGGQRDEAQTHADEGCSHDGPRSFSFQHSDLLAQCQVFDDKIGSPTRKVAKGAQKNLENSDHRRRLFTFGRRKNTAISEWTDSFGRQHVYIPDNGRDTQAG